MSKKKAETPDLIVESSGANAQEPFAAPSTTQSRIETLLAGINDEVKSIDSEIARLLNQAATLEEKKKSVLASIKAFIGETTATPEAAPAGEKPKKVRRKKRVSVTADDVLKALAEEERNVSQVANVLGCSNMTARKALAALEKDKKVTSRQEGVSLMFKKK